MKRLCKVRVLSTSTFNNWFTNKYGKPNPARKTQLVQKMIRLRNELSKVKREIARLHTVEQQYKMAVETLMARALTFKTRTK